MSTLKRGTPVTCKFFSIGWRIRYNPLKARQNWLLIFSINFVWTVVILNALLSIADVGRYTSLMLPQPNKTKRKRNKAWQGKNKTRSPASQLRRAWLILPDSNTSTCYICMDYCPSSLFRSMHGFSSLLRLNAWHFREFLFESAKFWEIIVLLLLETRTYSSNVFCNQFSFFFVVYHLDNEIE